MKLIPTLKDTLDLMTPRDKALYLAVLEYNSQCDTEEEKIPVKFNTPLRKLYIGPYNLAVSLDDRTVTLLPDCSANEYNNYLTKKETAQ